MVCYSIQRGRDRGVMPYMLPLRRGISEAQNYNKWGTQFDSFWRCYGTGIESFSKFGDSIYSEEKANSPSLYIIQYIPSTLDWKSGQVSVSQKIEPVVSWDNRLRMTITVSSNGHSSGVSSMLNLRISSWTHSSGAKATLNGKDLSLPTLEHYKGHHHHHIHDSAVSSVSIVSGGTLYLDEVPL